MLFILNIIYIFTLLNFNYLSIAQRVFKMSNKNVTLSILKCIICMKIYISYTYMYYIFILKHLQLICMVYIFKHIF